MMDIVQNNNFTYHNTYALETFKLWPLQNSFFLKYHIFLLEMTSVIFTHPSLQHKNRHNPLPSNSLDYVSSANNWVTMDSSKQSYVGITHVTRSGVGWKHWINKAITTEQQPDDRTCSSYMAGLAQGLISTPIHIYCQSAQCVGPGTLLLYA